MFFAFTSALQKLRGRSEVEDDISEMESESLKSASAGEDDKVSVWEVVTLRDSDWKIPFLISMCVNIGQQLSGINAVSNEEHKMLPLKLHIEHKR